jgi:hypothetical protein
MMTASAPSMAPNKRFEHDTLLKNFIKSGLTFFQLYEKGGVCNEFNKLLVVTSGGGSEDFRVGGLDSTARDLVAGRTGSGEASLQAAEAG